MYRPRRLVNTQTPFQVKAVDWYTKDKYGTCGKDRDQVPYLYQPYLSGVERSKIKFNLDRYNPNDISKTINDVNEENIDTLLDWIVDDHKGPAGRPVRLASEFVSYRGVLTKIMCSPYTTNDDLRVCAIKVNGTIYLCKFLTPAEKKDVQFQFRDPKQLKCTKFGRVFEVCMTTKNPEEKPDGNEAYSEFEELSFVYNTICGGHKLLYSAELDALDNEYSLDNLDKSYIYELKTCGDHVTVRKFAEQKLPTWWAQSLLAKVNSIVVGYRSDAGIVQTIEVIKVKDMPYMAYGWSAGQCMKALQDFLHIAKRAMQYATQGDVYEFSWKAGRKMLSRPKFRVLPKENNHCYFLPSWYISWLKDGRLRQL